MSTEKKCPKCGAAVAYTDMIYKTVFLCASKIAHSGYFYQGRDCELATLRTALEKAKEALSLALPFLQSAKGNAERGSYAAHDKASAVLTSLSPLARDNGDL